MNHSIETDKSLDHIHHARRRPTLEPSVRGKSLLEDFLSVSTTLAPLHRSHPDPMNRLLVRLAIVMLTISIIRKTDAGPPLKNCSTYPEPNNCACHHANQPFEAGVGGDPGAGNCFACGSCHSCFGCRSCIKCHDNGMPPSPTPPPPPPPAPHVPSPAPWAPRVAAAQMLAAQSDPSEPGLFPSVGNGFISTNVGCATGSKGGVNEFFLHVGGVFNNRIAIHPRGAVSIPKRADVPNPFAAVAHIQGSPNAQAGTALDLEFGFFSNVTAAKIDGREVRVSTTVYAHRAHRSLLVFEVTADFGAGQHGDEHEDGDGGGNLHGFEEARW